MDVLLKNPIEGLMENRQEIGSSDQEGTAKSINRLIIRVSNRKIVACSQQQQQQEDEDKKDQSLGFKNHNRSSSVSNNNGDDSSPCCCCSVCGKSFGSMRALFGHMRCHPERQWRGIIQPCKTGISTVNGPSSSSLSTGSDDRSGGGSGLTSESNPDFNLLGFLPNWSVSRKRRTRQNNNNNNNNDHHDLLLLLSDDRVADAVSALLTLKDVVSFDHRTSKKVDDSDCRRQVSERKRTRELQESDIINRDFGTKKLKHLHKEEGGGEVKCVSIHPWASLNGSQVEMEVGESSHHNCNNSDPSRDASKLIHAHQVPHFRYGFDSDSVNMNSAMVCFSGSSEEEFPKSKGLEPGSSTCRDNNTVRNLMLLQSEDQDPRVEAAGMSDYKSSNEFKCSNCNKSFSTYHALGGHKSSQKNCKNMSKSAQSRDYGFHVHDSQEYSGNSTKPKDSGTHKCKTCGMSFATGQALGGHQRKHWNGSTTVIEAVPLNSIAPQEKSANMEASSTNSLAKEQAQATSVEVRKPLDFDLNEMPVN